MIAKRYAHIIGWGSYLPERVVTNDELAKTVDTNDEWIQKRTGIRQRHVADRDETTATLAFEAAIRALHVAKVSPNDVDLIIVATGTAYSGFPSTACLVQNKLGASNAGAFDLGAACSGFVYAMDMASQAIASGSIDTALVIGAETMSRIIDWLDRGTCILFGDGAGAVVLQSSETPGGVLKSIVRSDGSGANLLYIEDNADQYIPALGGKLDTPSTKDKNIQMQGRQVFRFATKVVPDIIREITKQAELTVEDIDLIVPHQANLRIIESAAKRLKVSQDLFYVNVQNTANTSAASIPIALAEAANNGRLKPDDTVVFVGFGAGLTWGANLIKWNVTPQEPPSNIRRFRYRINALRTRVVQTGRKFVAWLYGSPTPNARLKDGNKKK